jgi:tetratricopeptide (TPR) repeat protein
LTEIASTVAGERESDNQQTSDDAPKAKIFISYSRRDRAFADRIEVVLKQRGFEPLIDRAEIYAFEDWWARLQNLIVKADTVVFVLSPDSATSEVCAREVEFAASLHKRFAPIVCRRVEDRLVPALLAKLNFIFFDDEALFDSASDRLAEALATDIDWIRKHTEFGEASQRWEDGGKSAGLLLRSPVLEEAEHWIASRPQGAPEPTEITQALIADSRRGATRRRNVLTGSLTAGLVIALGLAGLAYWQRNVAIEQRQYAERALDASIRTSNDLSLNLAKQLRDQAGIRSSLVKSLLDMGLELQTKIASLGRVTSELLDSQGRALLESSKTRRTIGDIEGALVDANNAGQLFTRVYAAKPELSTRLNIAVASELAGDMLLVQGKVDEVLAAYQRSLADAQAVAEADSTNTNAQEEIAINDVHIGDVLLGQRKFGDALVAYQTSLTTRQSIFDRDKSSAEALRGLGHSYERVGIALLDQGKRDDALAVFRKRLAIAQQLASSNPDYTTVQRELAVADVKVGDALLSSGRFDEALAVLQNALAIRQKLASGDQGNAVWQRDLAVGYYAVASAQAAQGKVENALTSFRDGLSIERKLISGNPNNVDLQRDVAATDIEIGDLLKAGGKLNDALQSYSDEVEIARRVLAAHPSDAEWQDHVGHGVLKVGFLSFRFVITRQFQKGLEVAERAIALAPEMEWLNGQRAHALMFLDRTDEARTLYLRYRDVKDVFRNPAKPMSWSEFVLSEFSDLRASGLENPLMPEIEKQLAAPQ